MSGFLERFSKIASQRDKSFLTTEIDGVSVIAPARNVERHDVPALEAVLKRISATARSILLDLGSCQRVAPTAVVTILRWAVRFRVENRRFGVCTAKKNIRLLLDDVDPMTSLVVYEDLSTGLKALLPERRRPLGEILLSQFGLSRKALYRALEVQGRGGVLLGQILLAHRAIRPVDLARALALQGRSVVVFSCA